MSNENESEAVASDSPSPFDVAGGRRIFRACAVLLFGAELLVTGQYMVEYGVGLLLNRDSSAADTDTDTA